MKKENKSKEAFAGQKVLDDLINESYKALLHEVKKNTKIGEFLKMIEFRNKMAPAAAAQKKFWDMLDAIRREAQDKSGKNKKDSRRSGNATPSRKSDTAGC